MPMTTEQLEEFRHLLNEQLHSLVGEAKDTVEGMHEATKDTFADPTDRALLESNRNFNLRISDRERRLITKVQEAISRIDAGTFGVCEECGEDIGPARLRARPVTTLCIECKEDQERREKRV
jgi:DnaK suppressor protein